MKHFTILLACCALLLGCESECECAPIDVDAAISDASVDASSDSGRPVDAGYDGSDAPDAQAAIDANVEPDGQIEIDAGDGQIDATITPGEMEKVNDFSGASLNMYRYAPNGVPANAPLVVALHGCSQSAEVYANTGWNELANQRGFYVLYPETTSLIQNKCFQWFSSFDASRGRGQAAAIIAMVDRMKADYSIDASRVFVTGLSAGGAMTAAMLASYPDVFAGGAILAGIPFACATSSFSAFSCMNPGKDKTPMQWGELVRNAHAEFAGSYPKVSIWHGKSDATVRPLNALELIDQWSDIHEINVMPTSTTSPNARTNHFVYGDGQIEYWEIENLGHAVPIEAGCGMPAPYIENAGICSTTKIADFFSVH